MTVSDIIRQTIQSNGPISFRDYMEMALYYPSLGYYTSGKNRIGEQGDFYTTPSVTPLLGELLGKHIERLWMQTGKGPFSIVEFGAGSGYLCQDILRQIKATPALYENVSYHIIEKNGIVRQFLSQEYSEKVSVCESIKEVAINSGCVISNELVDNIPFHRVVVEEELMEIYVDYKDGFHEITRPASDRLKNYLTELSIQLPLGFRTEINLDALQWMEDVASAMSRGFVITIDYGGTSDQLYDHRRSGGTMRCYRSHNVTDDPYEHVGDQDITAHVNFSALKHWGGKLGLASGPVVTQGEYLRSLGLVQHIRELELSGKYVVEDIRQKLFLMNTLLIDMGVKFKVLQQHKGVDIPESLSPYNLGYATSS